MENFLSEQVKDCTWAEIKEMFDDCADTLTKQIYFDNKYYQCHFIGLHCCSVSELNKDLEEDRRWMQI